MTGTIRHDKIDIVAWLEREAAADIRQTGHSDSERAARLREASAELRSLRADKVAGRFGPRMAPLQAKERRS